MSLQNWEDASEEVLSEMLSYKLPQSQAGAIVSRRFTTWGPAGTSSISPTGTRTVRFVLAGDQGFVVPDTLQFKCRATAADTTGLKSDAGLAAAFTRLRIYVAGALVEDIAHYNRNFRMLQLLGPKEAADNMKILTGEDIDAFDTSGEMTLTMPVLGGLYFCEKLLNLKACGSITIELECTPTASEFATAAWTLQDCQLMCDIVEAR